MNTTNNIYVHASLKSLHDSYANKNNRYKFQTIPEELIKNE